MSKQASQLYEFGPFRVDPRECLLLRDGQALALTPKAFETLLVLIQNAGHLLPKEELMKSIWPDSYVEEVNLSQNISMLRKALGDTAQGSRYIVTVPGRGYRFTEKVRSVPQQDDIVLASRSITQVVIDEESSPNPKPALPAAKRRVRSMATLVLILALMFAGYWAWRRSRPLNPANPSKVMLAVLPFQNLTGDPEQEYFADGLTEEMITQLGRL